MTDNTASSSQPLPSDLDREFAGRRILITGGLGFIGSTLTRRLADAGAHIVVVDSLIPAYGGNLTNLAGYTDRVTVNIADVRDEYSMDYLVRGQDVLFNLAGQTSHLDSMRDPYTDLDINVRSQLSILEACRKNNPNVKIVYASTRQFYGKPDYLPVDERHQLHPTDVNGINKMAGEWYHIVYNSAYRLRTTSLRLTNTYGPRMRIKDARQTFLGVWLKQVLMGESILVYGDGRQLRDFSYVDDVVEAMLLTALDSRADGQIYNLGSLEPPICLLDLARLLIDLNSGGHFRLIPFPPDRKAIDIGDYYADFSKIKHELNWAPRVPLAEGLRRSLDYYRDQLSNYL
jgi:UDP-glucose 4-epimerase